MRTVHTVSQWNIHSYFHNSQIIICGMSLFFPALHIFNLFSHSQHYPKIMKCVFTRLGFLEACNRLSSPFIFIFHFVHAHVLFFLWITVLYPSNLHLFALSSVAGGIVVSTFHFDCMSRKTRRTSSRTATTFIRWQSADRIWPDERLSCRGWESQHRGMEGAAWWFSHSLISAVRWRNSTTVRRVVIVVVEQSCYVSELINLIWLCLR